MTSLSTTVVVTDFSITSLEEGFRDDSDDEPERLARNNFRS